MKYDRKNIIGLKVKRGGYVIYTVLSVNGNSVCFSYPGKHKITNYVSVTLSNTLDYLESKTWTIVKDEPIINENYKLF